MKKRTKITLSFILVVCLLLSGLPSVAATEVDEALTSPITESTVTEPQAVAEQTAAITEEIPVLQLDADCQILNHVDPEVFAAGNHIARLPEQETLSSYVFLNADGSQTVYYMDQPVKFEKADGTVAEKNLTLTAATEGYTTTQNDIQLTIPTDPTNGIRMVYDSHYITLIPQGGTLTTAAQATDNSVTYPDYYGEGMSLRYTPTLSGVKEDILLDAYSGVNSFTFRLNTGGLNLYQASGRYFLAESKVATNRIELGEVVSYDAKSKFSIGTMTAQTIMPGQAYMLTLTVDEAFLTDENTTYPVTIDPTLTVSYGNNGDNYIIDAPIFEGYPSKNYGAFQYNRVGYVDSSYQSGRTVVKLPVLTSSSIYTSLTDANITSVKFYAKEATGSSGISVSLYPLTTNSTWSETSVTWNNVGSRASAATSFGTLTDSAWTAFNITSLVKQWKNGTYNANCGFIMIGASENSTDKSFCSSEHEKTSYRPYVVMTYNSSISLSYTATNVVEGGTRTINATTDIEGEDLTWSSSNTSVATVNNGVVTGVKAGTVIITATKADGSSASCLVYVVISNGVYRISNASLMLGTYGSIEDNTSAYLFASTDSGLAKLRQLWKIKYLGSGYYCIRPMHKLDMALHSTSGTVDITTIGTTDTLDGVQPASRWGIEYASSGYLFMYAGTSSLTMRCSATYPTATIITEVYSSSISSFKWTITKINSTVSGAYLYDTYKESAITDDTTKYVIYNRATSLSSLNLVPVVYSNSYIDQSFSWEVEDPTVAAINPTSGTITGLKSGSTVVSGTPNKGSTQPVSFNLIVVGSEQYGVGVRIATIDGVQYYDFTTPVNNLFDEAVILCGDHRCMTYSQYCSYMYDISPTLEPTVVEWRSTQLGSFLWFYRQVNHGAVWDIKLESQWDDALPNVPYIGMDVSFVFRGEKTTAEDLGNIMYGYTGRATGFGATTLYWGGGVAKQGSVNSDEVTQPPYYGDDENDHDMIERGYNLFVADYPDYPDVGYDGIPLDGWLADIADIILDVGS